MKHMAHSGLRSIFAGLAIGIFGLGGTAMAQLSAADGQSDASASAAPTSNIRIVREAPVRLTSVKNFYRVSADKTPSGFAVPRYVSLKFGRVNGRTGPSRDHPVAWQYQRRGLPLIVVAETEMWRKVRDITGDEAWVRKQALTGERTVIALDEIPVYAKPNADARLIAKSDMEALMKLGECLDGGFCKVASKDGIEGWAPRTALWGAQSLN